MKHLRLFILILLSVLLPVRGALAATMLCPQGEATSTAVVVAGHEHHELQSHPAVHADHSAAHHHAGEAASGEESPSGEHPTTCNFCASGCCMASIVGVLPSVASPGPTASVAFPMLTAPAPAFQSGGQDRPPRTC